MPLEADIHKAYRLYYTHDKNSREGWFFTQLLAKIVIQILKLFLRLTPLHRERKAFSRMYLENIKPGRLLEVGCGDGTRLTQLAALGWSVEGQEVDPISAAAAREKGIKIHLGPLENIRLPDASYDAIVMNHVIEHLYEPVILLSECRRLLSSQGTLISVTPNISSFGHRIFKSNWRGLEPPRHIFLYSQGSLRRIAQMAGFKNPTSWTTASGAHHFAQGSLKIIYGSNKLNLFNKTVCYFAPKLFLLVARLVQAFDNDSGEECVLMLRNGQ
jgi:2-polyprenyl-3-methyl-5-hydroxy-6-metoxy-1,4-benzoquinol methylase